MLKNLNALEMAGFAIEMILFILVGFYAAYQYYLASFILLICAMGFAAITGKLIYVRGKKDGNSGSE